MQMPLGPKSFWEQGGAEVSLAEVGQDHDDHLARVLGAMSHLNGDMSRRRRS